MKSRINAWSDSTPFSNARTRLVSRGQTLATYFRAGVSSLAVYATRYTASDNASARSIGSGHARLSYLVFSSASKTWGRYGSILRCSRSTLPATLPCLRSYEQCMLYTTQYWKGYINAIIRISARGFTNRYRYSPSSSAPSGVVRIYQSSHSLLCYNNYINVAIALIIFIL